MFTLPVAVPTLPPSPARAGPGAAKPMQQVVGPGVPLGLPKVEGWVLSAPTCLPHAVLIGVLHAQDVAPDPGERLVQAVREGQAGVVEQLLKAQPALANQAEGGVSVLALAASQGREEVVRVLLAHGANPQWQGEDGRAPLDHATSDGVRQQLELVSADLQSCGMSH